MSQIRSVLFDRDGTLIVDKHYLSDPAEVELLPGAAEGLGMLSWAGVRLFVATNQSGIGRGYFTEDAYHACAAALSGQLAEKGITIAGTAFCPHSPEENCHCRKPALGMWHVLRERYDLRSDATAMVGDKAEDIAFGLAAGFPATVLVLTGKGEAAAKAMNLPSLPPDQPFMLVADRQKTHPHILARDMTGTALWLLSQTPLDDCGPHDSQPCHTCCPAMLFQDMETDTPQ